MKTDNDIALSKKSINIIEVAKKINLTEDDLESYGKYKAKICKDDFSKKEKGKLILVTSINPTPYGEGKTTVTIGINDALRKLGMNSLAVLREPSLGPVFGIKGGATGGGYSQVVPADDINLHFTGDIHAITACNNLLCAIIDNHIFSGNELNINPSTIQVNRCLDINDRALRNITIDNKGINRNEQFNITAASEIMAILCLANDFNDLKIRISDILVGYNYDKKPIFVKDLKCTDALAILLKDAIYPNLVQSLENNPVIIHGGPFANIAHGCNSVIATKLALNLSDYVITEAGFGADLGAEKFFDIKCQSGLTPNLVIINVTLKALKHNGYLNKDEINLPNLESIKTGISNLETHINNMRKFDIPIIVCLNKFYTDTLEEIEFVRGFVEEKNVKFEICDSYKLGSDGATDLASSIIKLVNNNNDFKFLYDLNDTITNKIDIICKEIYQAKEVTYTNEVIEKIKEIENINLDSLPICIAKNQYSFSDNPKLLGSPKDHTIHVTDIKLFNGAKFITVYLGDIITMPGLSKNPAALNMKIDEKKRIQGL